MITELKLAEQSVARIYHPSGGGVVRLDSLLAACGGHGGGEESVAKAFQRRLDAIGQARRLEQMPIVGVCGTVNSGKSTVVAGFLSEEGRRRVLVGLLGKERTHRFVFWLPLSWQANGLGATVEEMIARQTGELPERLTEDRDEAASQYNAMVDRARKFNIPLVAYDAALDAGGIAFLDCPDIQSSLDESVDELTAYKRLERLRSIAPLCSAFVVVASMQQAGTEPVGMLFEALRQAASRAPLYFVLNMTDSDEVEVYLPEAEAVLNRWHAMPTVKRIYLAPHVQRKDRSLPVRPIITSMDGDRVPLSAVTGELDPAELQKSHQASCVASLKELLVGVRKLVSDTFKAESERALDARKRVCDFLAGKFVDGEGRLKSLSYDEAAKRLAESIQRTAPAPIRMAQAPGNWLKGLLVKFKRRDATDADVEQYAHVKASEFAVFLMGCRFMPPEVEAKALERIWENAKKAVKEHAGGAFSDEKELDAMTRAMWNEVPLSKKFALFRNIMWAVVGITIVGALAPIDGGASVVIWTKFHMVLGGAEILGVLVGGPLLGTILSTGGAQSLVTQFEREVARPQLDVLYAALCDGLGIPRYLDGPPELVASGRVVHPFTEVPLPMQEALVKLLQGPLIRLDDVAWDQMMSELERVDL